MNLLDALVMAVQRNSIVIPSARLAHFAFTEKGDSAFITELEVEELVPLLEDWCRARRAEIGPVN